MTRDELNWNWRETAGGLVVAIMDNSPRPDWSDVKRWHNRMEKLCNRLLALLRTVPEEMAMTPEQEAAAVSGIPSLLPDDLDGRERR